MPSLGVEEGGGRDEVVFTCCGYFSAANGKSPMLRVLKVSCVFLGVEEQWHLLPLKMQIAVLVSK